MASFREHVSVSGMLGLGYGLGAALTFGFTPTQSALAGFLAGIGGMLPDLDSPTGRPGQEIFGLTAAVVPLVLIGRLVHLAGLPNDTETVILGVILMYFGVRYGLAGLVAHLSVHRGMFHSVPAMLIVAEGIYLCYPSELASVKLLMAGAIAVGFLSHLLLDELYSVSWDGPLPRFKKSFGTALKLMGKSFVPNAVTYSLLASLTYAMLEDSGVIVHPPADVTAEVEEDASAPEPDLLESAPLYNPESVLPSNEWPTQTVEALDKWEPESDAPLYH